MDFLNDIATWAWARHHNLLSWYIRPLFLLPFCFFAYRRSGKGIALTVIALATSMFWFPAPEQPDSRAIEMLEAEREYLLGTWTLWKVAIALLIPLGLGTLALAFWKRSICYGTILINVMVLFKIGWTFVFAEAESALLHLLPAVLGLAICNVAMLVVFRWWQRRATFNTAQARG
jgi:hypothetical protein